MKITPILQLSTTLALCVAAARAADPVATIGHTAVLVDNTVFIQGGQSAPNTPQASSFSILLGEKGSMTGAKLLDITKFSKLSARDFHVAVESIAGRVVSCGSMNGPAAATMSCDNLNIRTYVSEPLAKIPTSAENRGGMAIAVDAETAYLTGGSNGDKFSNIVNILKLTSDLGFRVDVPMPQALRHHTATYVTDIGVVILGGQTQGGAAAPMTTASILKDAVWTNRTIAGDTVTPRWGHTTVLTANNQLIVYGGLAAATGPALSDVYALDLAAAAWAWRKVNVQAEPRAFHTSTLLPDNTILNMFGTSGAGVEQAVATLSSYNPSTNSWAAMTLPAAEVANASPVKGSETSNNPNDPNFKHSTGEEPTKSNTGVIAGVSVAVVVLLVVGGLLFQRHRRRSKENASAFSRQNRAGVAGGTAPHSADERNGKSGGGGVARSFTIRKPASVNYVDDDNDLDQTGHPRFKSDSDAQNHPYYGDRTPGLVEYELSDTSGQKYGPSSVAERKRYVEQQQRKVMEEYEMSFQDYNPPSSPYPQSTIAPSYTSNTSPVQTPTMGGRSPRAQHQTQHQGIQQQYGGYADY